jgi:CDP-diacylglycerol--serine O-phosphatidyltransferase
MQLEKILIGKYDKSVLLTYVGAASAVVGCAAAIQGAFTMSMICLILSGVCDMFDGKVARMCTRDDTGKAFGVQIDSLSDVVAFLILPAIYGYVFLFQVPYAQKDMFLMPLWCKAIFILYILAGLIRLAWFNLHATLDKPVAYYTGLPVTSAAIIFPCLHLIGLFVPMVLTFWLMAAAFLVMAVLFVARIRIPKFTGAWYVVCSVAAGLMIAVFIVLKCLRCV